MVIVATGCPNIGIFNRGGHRLSGGFSDVKINQNESLSYLHYTYKKWSFPLRISSVNVTKSPGSCGFGHIYWRNPYWKTSFFIQC